MVAWRLVLLCPKSCAAHVGTCFSRVRASVSELQAKQKSKASEAIPMIAIACSISFFVHMSFNRIVCMTFALSHCSCSCSLMCCRLSPLWPWHHVVCVAVFSLCSVLQSYVRLYSRRYRGHVHRLSQGFGHSASRAVCAMPVALTCTTPCPRALIHWSVQYFVTGPCPTTTASVLVAWCWSDRTTSQIMAALQEAERYSCVVLMGQGVVHVRATGMAHTARLAEWTKALWEAMHMATVPSTVQSHIRL